MDRPPSGMSLLPLPFTYWDLRESARNGYTWQDRRFYWPHVVTFAPKSKITTLEDVSGMAQRMFDRVSLFTSGPLNQEQAQLHAQLQAQSLSHGSESDMHNEKEDPSPPLPKGEGGGLSEVRLSWRADEELVRMVMRAVSAHFPITQPGLLEPLVWHVARVLDDTASCFFFFSNYLEKSYWYSIPSLTAHRYKLNTFRQLANRCMKNTYAILLDIGALEEPHLNLIFVDRLAELLPEKYFYRVLDMYFIEGYKILYRFGLAILKVNKSRIKAGEFKTGTEFWESVKIDAKKKDFDFTSIFNFAFDNRRNNFFKISIVPGRARLQAFEAATRSVMTQEELAAPLQQELFSLVSAHDPNKLPVDVDDSALLDDVSHILDRDMAERLYSYLLPAAQMEGFDMKFSTYDDGWNLQTLYNKTQHLAPCILLIKTLDSSVGGGAAVIGMYLSCAVAPPHGSIRGDGMCFCFRLDGPDAQCYRWMGQTNDSVQVLQSTQLQFAICASDYMAFGGSAQHGTNAIRLSSDLAICETGESDTYGNPPLVSQSQKLGGPGGFKVGDVEMFCGKLSHLNRRV